MDVEWMMDVGLRLLCPSLSSFQLIARQNPSRYIYITINNRCVFISFGSSFRLYLYNFPWAPYRSIIISRISITILIIILQYLYMYYLHGISFSLVYKTSNWILLFLFRPFPWDIVLCRVGYSRISHWQRVGTRRKEWGGCRFPTNNTAIMWTMWINSNLDSEGWAAGRGGRQRPAIQADRTDHRP